MRTTILLALILVGITPCAAQFSDPAPVLSTAQMEPVAVSYHAVDLTADGNVDVVAQLQDSIGFYPSDGAGGFGAFVRSPDRPMAYADLDGDGAMDILTVPPAESGVDHVLYAWLNEGAGTFSEAGPLVSTAGQIVQVVAADLDGDGDQDLLYITAHTQPSIRSLRGLFNNGDGTWTSEQLDSAPEYVINLILHDVDGRDEAIVRGTEYYTARWMDGAFIRTVMPGIGSNVPIRGADLNNDGHEDLLVFDYFSEASLLLRASDGFGWVPAALPAVEHPGYEHWSLGDLDSDGDVDLLYSGPGRLLLFANDGTGTDFEEITMAETLGTIWFDRDLAPPPGLLITALTDLDNDGDLDALIGLYALLNNGTGSLSGPHALRPDAASTMTELIFADLDNDGYDDAIYADPVRGLLWFQNLGGGAFSGPREILSAMASYPRARTYDLDGDGWLDVTYESRDRASIAWARNLGNGDLEPVGMIQEQQGEAGKIIDLVDVDGDGDGDILYLTVSGGIRLLTNAGDGTFTDGLILDQGDPEATGVVVRDINGDGLPDIMTHQLNGAPELPGVNFLFNEGNRVWSAPQAQPWPNVSWDTPLVDIDMDGDMDVIIHRCEQCGELGYPDLAWTANLGGGNWSEFRVLDRSFGAPFFSAEVEAFHFADVDQDGDVDLLVSRDAGSASGLYLVENLGGVFGQRTRINEGRWSFQLGTADLLGGTPALDIVGHVQIGTFLYSSMQFMGNIGGATYQIRGNVFLDTNENGQRDLNEPPVPGHWVATQPTGAGANTFATGDYVVLCSEGTHTVRAPSTFVASSAWGLTTPAQIEVQVNSTNTVVSSNDFGIRPLASVANLNITAMQGESWCGGTLPIWYTIMNTGTRNDAGVLRLSLDPRFTPTAYLPANAQVEDTVVVWEFGPLAPFESISFLVNVVSPTFEAMGTEAFFLARVNTLDENGNITGLFLRELKWRLACAYDPNDKQVSPEGYGTYGAIALDSTHVEYTIRFQNTGTAPAYNITLLDQLAAELDPTRIEVLDSSHPIDRVVVHENGEMEVSYFYIMLPDSTSDPAGSQGYVRFRIALQDELPHSTAVTNSASIYFDLNPPIITNTTITTLVDCDLWEPVVENPLPDLLQATEGDDYQWYLGEEAIPGATEQWFNVEALGEYSVEVTSVYGCSAISSPIAVISLAVEERDTHRLLALPNPFSSSTTIRSTKLIMPDQRIVLSDVEGRILRSSPGNGSLQVDLAREGLSSGLYFARIVSSTGMTEATLRLIVE